MTSEIIKSGRASLATAVIEPADSPKAVLVLVHGMAEHKERYYPFMTYLSEQGYACIITDLRGHGASVKDREDLGFFGRKGKKWLIEDTRNVIAWARKRYPSSPVYLMGHSMGSLIVRCFVKRYDSEIAGLIVCGSPSKVSIAPIGIFLTRCIGLFKGKRFRSAMLEQMSTGGYNKAFLSEGLPNAWLSTNKANVMAYNNDPLCGFRFTVNGYRTLMQLLVDCYSASGLVMSHPSLPVHFIAGSEDPCIGSLKQFSQAVGFFLKRGYSRVSSRVFPGMRHEILNETGREAVWQEVESVLNSWSS